MPMLTTQMAGLGRRRWIDKHQRHTHCRSFVGHELPQLEEAPTLVTVPMRLADLGPLPYARQIFTGNLALGSDSLVDELLADGVVDRSHVATLSSRQPVQQPIGFLCAFGLERTSDFGVVGTQPVNLGSFIECGIRIDGHAASTKINPQRACRYRRSRSRTPELDMQKERAIAAFDQHSTGQRLPFEPSFLVVAQCRRKAYTAVEQRQTKGPVPLAQAEDALIVINRGGRKRRVGFALDLQRGPHPSDSTDSQVCRQTKALAHLIIRLILDFDLVARMDTACHFSDEITRLGKGGQRRVEFNTLRSG